MEKIEVPHGEGVLVMHPITAAVKKAFVTWLRPRYILESLAVLEDAKAAGIDGDELKKLEQAAILARQEVNAGGLFWTAEPSQAVASALMTEAGVVRLARLQFPESMKGWTDAAIRDYIAAQKEGSPYQVAFQLAWENADPKAERPPTTSEAPPAMTASTTT